MRALGLMSGTSADGIDAAILETDGERIHAFGSATTTPYPELLRAEILAIMADPHRAEHDPLTALETALTEAHATAARTILDPAVAVVGMHGQTLLHRPERRLTRQLGDGALLAGLLQTTVVDRFRHADVAAGGQGAPLVPLFHQALLRDMPGPPGPWVVLNLGGVANITYLDGPHILAFDTGPANALLDDWVRTRTGAPCDENGALAATGHIHKPTLAALLDNPYFARIPPKSLDRNAFSITAPLSTEDGAATLAAFTIDSIVRALDHLPTPPRRWLVAGGGRHNATLMRGLATALSVPIDPVEAQGWDGDALEAQAFAFLAVRALKNLPLSLPTTTGVPYPMPGGRIHAPPAAPTMLD